MKARFVVRSLAVCVVVGVVLACRSSPPEANRNPTTERLVDAGATGQSGLEACVDGWVRENKLDPYGNPEGTMYAGGTPLFDERTGERKERVAYVLEHHPEARRACADGGR